jgi:hypothetical protein
MRISLWKRYSYAVSLTALGAVAAVTYATAVHAGPSIRTVQLRDDCEPTSFNQAIPPDATGRPACSGNGDTTFNEFLDELAAQGSVDKWRFNPVSTEADRGVNTENRGGESHTFTEVARFGGGFVALLNGGIEPATECAVQLPGGGLAPTPGALASLVPSGTTGSNKSLGKGVHRFQCCIHPWMHTTVVVK